MIRTALLREGERIVFLTLRHLNRAYGSIFFENYLSLRFQEWVKGNEEGIFLTG
jgi:hypothetical protein